MTRMLTRDERHMLSAALGMLRANVLAEPTAQDGIAWYALYDVLIRLEIAEDYGARVNRRTWWAALIRGASRGLEWSPIRSERRHRERILRARLALAIRAVLRADRGERGAWWALTLKGREDDESLWVRRDDAYAVAFWAGGRIRRREALWTTAPGHEVGR